MKKMIPLIAAGAVLLLSLAAAAAIAVKRSGHQIQFAYQAAYEGRFLAGIDMADNRYYVFRSDISETEQDFFTIPLEERGTYHILNELIIDEEGNAYVHHIRGDIKTREVLSETIDYCDFSAGKLTERWKVSEVSGGRHVGNYYIPGDGIYLIMQDVENRKILWYRLNPDGTAKLDQTSAVPQSAKIIYFDKEKEIWASTFEGDVYKIRANGSERLIFRNDGSQVGVDNVSYSFQGKEFHFKNLTDGNNYVIDLATGGKLALCKEHQDIQASAFDSSRLFNGDNLVEREVYFGVLPLDSGRQIPAVYGEDGELALDFVTRGADKTAREAALLFILFSGAGLCWIGSAFLMKRREGGAPVWGMITFFMVPFLGAGYLMTFWLTNARLVTDGERENIQYLAGIGRDLVERIPMEQFLSYREQDVFTEKELEELVEEFNSGSGRYWDRRTSSMQQASEEEGINAALYFWKDGEVYSACRSYQLNVPVQYVSSAAEYAGLSRAARENRPVYAPYSTLNGRFFSVFLPVSGTDGEVLGVLQVEKDIQWSTLENIENARELRRWFGAVSLSLLILVQLILWRNMRPLKQLRKAFSRMADGNLSARAGIRGAGEIAGVGRLFDRMAGTLERQAEGTEAFRRKYEAFVPAPLFFFLNRKGIRAVKAGDETELWASILAVGAAGMGEKGEPEGRNPFKDSNRFLAGQIPLIREKGGIIRRLIGRGGESIFPENSQKKALDAAVSVLKAAKGGSLCAGIARERLKFGVIGSKKRLVTALISSHGGLSWFLEQAAERLNASILITGEAAAEIGQFKESYHSRVFGYIYLTDSRKLEIVYEVLDGSSQERMRDREDTREEFEEGVRLFMAGRPGEARRKFIRVLERDREDLAAREYVGLCGRTDGEKRQDGEILCLFRY